MKRFANGYALLIGVDESHVDKWALPNVTKDIRALAEVLTHPQRCAYLDSHVKTITGRQATRDGILDGLDWLQAHIEEDKDSTAIVYYSGHIWRDDEMQSEFYLVPYDVREGDVSSRGLRVSDFAEMLGRLSPRRLLIMFDCCHTSEVDSRPPNGYISTAIAPLSWIKGIEALSQESDRAVLSSSTGNQRTYVRRDGTMSIFTYHLIEALTGHAQPQKGATEVLVSDVMGHVARHVPASARDQGEQTPDYQASGNFAVALLLGGKGLSKGRPAPDPLERLPEVTAPATYHAEVHGSGAIAQGPGTIAAGERGVAVGGDVQGSTLITGDGNVVGDGSSTRVVKVDEVSSGVIEVEQRIGKIDARGEVTGVTVEEWGRDRDEDGQQTNIGEMTTEQLKKLRLDAAVPDQVYLNRVFEVAVAVRQLSSPRLAEDDLKRTRSGDVLVNWPEDAPDIYLQVNVSAPECEIQGNDSVAFRLYPSQDSPVFYFELIPKKLGTIGIVVRVYQAKDPLGSTRVRTVVREQVVGSVQMEIHSRGFELSAGTQLIWAPGSDVRVYSATQHGPGPIVQGEKAVGTQAIETTISGDVSGGTVITAGEDVRTGEEKSSQEE